MTAGQLRPERGEQSCEAATDNYDRMLQAMTFGKQYAEVGLASTHQFSFGSATRVETHAVQIGDACIEEPSLDE
jgi:hypothetical protein